MPKVLQIIIPSTSKDSKQSLMKGISLTQRNEKKCMHEHYPLIPKTPNNNKHFSLNFFEALKEFNQKNNIASTQQSTANNSICNQTVTLKSSSSKNIFRMVSPRNTPSNSITNIKKYRNPDEIAQSYNLKYNFKFPQQNTESLNKPTNLFTSITQLNKEIIYSSVCHGKSRVSYSKRNVETVLDYFHNKEAFNEEKAELIEKEFKKRKQLPAGDFVNRVPKKIHHLNQKLSQKEFQTFKNKQEAHANMKRQMNSIEFVKKLVNITKTNNQRNRNHKQTYSKYKHHKTLSAPQKTLPNDNNVKINFDKVDFKLLQQKIDVYNLMKKSFRKTQRISKSNMDLQEDLGENTELVTNNSLKYKLKPYFIKTKFQKKTIYKFNGITGKFFGIPV